MTKEEKKQMKVEIAIFKTMVKFARKYDGDVVLRALRNVINDLNKVIEEKNNRRG